MAVKIKKGSDMLQLPVVPLVDTLFNLLIFFLVATKVAEAERELPVSLPEASEAQPITAKPREMVVNIDMEGRYFVTNTVLTLGQLDQVLQAAWAKNPGRASVVIRADKRCRWEFVVAAMNSCMKANIRDFRVTTKETPESS